MTAVSTRKLSELETVIERGLATFVEVGNALMEIRDGRLYRESHATFEDYCRERWGLERRRAYQLMEAAEVAENVKNFSHPLVTESHAKHLSRLPADQQPEAWELTVETAVNGKVTAAHVESVVQNYLNETEKQPGRPNEISVGDEYYTPPYVIKAARGVIGSIDLDPASCPKANQVVEAKGFYTKAEDGLAKPWQGTVWLNPPFSDPKPFVERLIHGYSAGHVTAALVLVNNGTETSWGQALLGSFPVCFFKNRISFWHDNPDRPLTGNRYAQMMFYLGPNTEAFNKGFSEFGAILEAQ